jgi:RNA polymerase primary sigma factor
MEVTMMTTKRKTVNQKEENILAMYLKEINRIPLLTREEETKYAREAADGNRPAQQMLAKANLRFVVNVAKRYQGRGLPLDDLIAEGNIGLLNAIQRFDVEKGYHFISYAVWWIRQAILKAICEKTRMIRLPMNRVNELIRIEKALPYMQEGKSEIQEVAAFLKLDPCYVEELLTISREMVSLDNPLYDEKDSSTVGDFIEAQKYSPPETLAIASALQNDLQNAFKGLDEKEADILRFRYGLENQTPLSLKEIGDRMNLTKERIRQIEKKAIKWLQQPRMRKILETYVA